ncbi:MAG: NUDIX domain-containing protein [Chlorobiota bacterium]|nr:NUDIX domain-containing protein [Chlorobiota bacterium]QQS66963.1 MAG: NUDIX domain-containing protein [Chlorobiota bacterium]
MTEVVVGILIDSNEKILICQRNKKSKYGLLWEFPGGKLELNETYEEGLIRELNEELRINIKVGELFYEENITYSTDEIFAVKFYLVREWEGIIQDNNGYEEIKFVAVQDIFKYEVLKGNVKVIKMLSKTILKEVELSSGGVVVRKNAQHEYEVLLVLLKLHNEWGFPKGHIEKSESSEETAIREVEEETGVCASILKKLPDTTYTYSTNKGKFKPKRVYWFLMEFIGEGLQTHSHEVSDVKWVTINEAFNVLSFPNDSNLLLLVSKILNGDNKIIKK